MNASSSPQTWLAAFCDARSSAPTACLTVTSGRLAAKRQAGRYPRACSSLTTQNRRMIRLASTGRKDDSAKQFGVPLMFRFLLGTMLIAAQILTGSWGNCTLCLRSDGTICCVHEQAAACSCCGHEHTSSSSADDHNSHSHAVCQVATTHDHEDQNSDPQEETLPLDLPLTSSIPCGCRHVPLSSNSAPNAQEFSRVTAADQKQSRSSIPPVHSFRITGRNDVVAKFGRLRSPQCLTVGLTIVSSIVIRC